MWPKSTLPKFSRHLISLASFIYKKSALVLLAGLFAIFVSYGVLIGFFLISNMWAAPVTLSKGHEFVDKTEQKINELKVQYNLIVQRVSKANRETELARRAMEDAKILSDFVASTVDTEIKQRTRMRHDVKVQLKRLEVVQIEMSQAVSKAGVRQDLQEKFTKRLINRQTYDTGLLAMLELNHRLAALENHISSQKLEISKLDQSLLMLESLKHQLRSPDSPLITAANTELVPLANQIVAVKTALNNAKVELASHNTQLKLLIENQQIVHASIVSLNKTPLARAINTPVVVLFAPYGNAGNFKKNAPLYSCELGIVWCTKVGKVSNAIAGETTSTHPFFGKNIRGTLIEAQLTYPEAARKEILHVNRPPLLF